MSAILPLPDCPSCSANCTLEILCEPTPGLLLAECSCCSTRCHVEHGEARKLPDVVDISGHVMSDP